ncbi:MAG TPA: hypothetical protein PK637_16515 [Flavobacteriales bacterium]|nr:hypothetical protein [Flavobacteriales bacterium]HRE98370.1 hypothetical protein [Flavobacteriales bacterium]HRJ39959.1 hypothetical protein [Flavobacteriales bacterium]
MKLFLLFFVSLFVPEVSAQKSYAKLYAHGWAGGVCCRQGTDYILTFTLKECKLKSVDSIVVCTGGFEFLVKPNEIQKGKKDLVIRFAIEFDDSKIATEQRGMPNRKTCNGEHFVIYAGGKSFTRVFTERTGHFSAYP